MPGLESAVWDDGDWIGWDEIHRQIDRKEWRLKYPKADLTLVPYFEDLLLLARLYHQSTGRHLNVYGDIGELFAAITHGVELHRNYAQGSDGRIGNEFVEVKTITPFKKNDRFMVKMTGNFGKLFVVRINSDFEVAGRMVNRADLPKCTSDHLRLGWDQIEELGRKRSEPCAAVPAQTEVRWPAPQFAATGLNGIGGSDLDEWLRSIGPRIYRK